MHCQIYQLWLLTHHSQIQLVLKIKLFKRVCGISYPLNFSRRQRLCLLCGLWETSFSPSNWVDLNLDFTSWFCILVLQHQLLALLSIWYWLLVAWITYVKINHQILGWLPRQRRDEYIIPMKDSALFVKQMWMDWNFLGVCAMSSWV